MTIAESAGGRRQAAGGRRQEAVEHGHEYVHEHSHEYVHEHSHEYVHEHGHEYVHEHGHEYVHEHVNGHGRVNAHAHVDDHEIVLTPDPWPLYCYNIPRMLRAIILDFNGVLINDEPLHARLMQETAAELGIELTLQAYYSRYLPLDDWHCLSAVLADNNRTLEPSEMERILEIKSARYQREVQSSCELFPGSVDFVRAAAARYPLAIASGAQGKEIRATLERAGIGQWIAGIVSADDVVESKPNPEAFLKACGLLKNLVVDLQPSDCLVIEDSIHGIGGAHSAGMKVVALAHSYSSEELREADFVAEDWSGVNLERLAALFD